MIETHELGKQFNDFWAVDGISVAVAPGKILALLGQNGAGKTTTVRMLSALIAPSRGTARVAGFDVSKNGSDVRRVVGVLTEQHGLYGRMTAQEYLEFFGELHGLTIRTRATRIDYLLEYFGLATSRRQRIGEYSKGMRQKLALARALIHEPPVLLLDEPTSAMDPKSSRLVRDEISRLRSSQRSIIMCTHNLAEAEELADSVAIIYRGRILVQGTQAELRRSVLGAPEYIARFVDDVEHGYHPPAGWCGDGANGIRQASVFESKALRPQIQLAPRVVSAECPRGCVSGGSPVSGGRIPASYGGCPHGAAGGRPWLRICARSCCWPVANSAIRARDWRIIVPLAILTLAFPLLMNEVARQAVAFFARFGTTLIADRLVPFSILIIGFFPITISLVVALESFVGEKERGTIEPLLNAPLKDWHLYCGKLLVGIVSPLTASYISIGLYLLMVSQQRLHLPEASTLLLLITLTTVHALLMVSAALVISVQSTSIRAANLLASFVIIPVALHAAGGKRPAVLGDRPGPVAGGIGGGRDGSPAHSAWPCALPARVSHRPRA